MRRISGEIILLWRGGVEEGMPLTLAQKLSRPLVLIAPILFAVAEVTIAGVLF